MVGGLKLILLTKVLTYRKFVNRSRVSYDNEFNSRDNPP